MANWGGGRMDGHLEIPPCVLQDIGPLGLLPKKYLKHSNFPLSDSIIMDQWTEGWMDQRTDKASCRVACT